VACLSKLQTPVFPVTEHAVLPLDFPAVVWKFLNTALICPCVFSRIISIRGNTWKCTVVVFNLQHYPPLYVLCLHFFLECNSSQRPTQALTPPHPRWDTGRKQELWSISSSTFSELDVLSAVSHSFCSFLLSLSDIFYTFKNMFPHRHHQLH